VERLLVLGTADLEDDKDWHSGVDPVERYGDGWDDGLVADHQVPV
jgi:hypothetical protein